MVHLRSRVAGKVERSKTERADTDIQTAQFSPVADAA